MKSVNYRPNSNDVNLPLSSEDSPYQQYLLHRLLTITLLSCDLNHIFSFLILRLNINVYLFHLVFGHIS